MDKRYLIILVGVFAASLSVMGCGLAQVLGPTPTPTPLPTSTATPTATPTPTPEFPTFTKDTGLEVAGVSEITGKGTVSFAAGASPATFKITLNGTLPIDDQEEVCWFCLDTIRIAPGLQVPVEFFGVLELDRSAKIGGGSLIQNFKIVEVDGVRVVKDPPEVESIGYNSLVLEYPLMADSANAIVAGDQGVTLRKDGRLFFLVEGGAHLAK